MCARAATVDGVHQGHDKADDHNQEAEDGHEDGADIGAGQQSLLSQAHDAARRDDVCQGGGNQNTLRMVSNKNTD